MSGSTITRLPGAPEVYPGSMKVLATKGSGKTPVVYAGVASVVAFMGPKRRRPPVFYFSSMMAADAEALATGSSLFAHPASVAACMVRLPAWESWPQQWETRYEAAAWTAATTPVRRSLSSWPGAASC